MHDSYHLVLVSFGLLFLVTIGFLCYRYIFPKKKVNLFFFLIILSLLPIISIFRQGTYQAGDLTLHSIFLQSFFENLREGILIPKWAGGLCGGHGCPVFLFEYTMPFYIGSFFHFLGFSYLNSMKLFLATSYMLSGITMYIFLKDEFNKRSAFIGALLYLFAPIHLMEMHFRVSVGTDAAFIFIPLVFLFAKKSLTGKPLFILLGAFNFLFLILSHSSITAIIVPASLMYVFLKRKTLKQLIFPLISYAIGVGISSFYILPAITEIKYTWTSQVITNITDFKPFLQYIYSPVRYGLLFQGNQGELRLIVGYIQVVIIIITFFYLLKKTISKKEKNIVIFMLIFFISCFVLMLSFTKPLWDNIFFLRTFVIPWRMLVPIAFVTSFLGALITKTWKNTSLTILCIFIVLSTILNWGNRKMIPFNQQHEYNQHWSLYTEYFEPNDTMYLHRYNSRVDQIPQLVLQRPKTFLEILSGNGQVKVITHLQDSHEYLVYAQTPLLLSENTYYFPGWKVYINGKPTELNITNKQSFGTMTFNVPKGLYDIKVEFHDTLIQTIGKWVSIITILGISIYILFMKKFNKFFKEFLTFLPTKKHKRR